MNKTRKHSLLIATGVAIGLLVLAIFLWIAAPFFLAQGKLTKEANRLKISGAVKEHAAYREGFCFDNCPQLTITYKITPTALGTERSKLIALVRGMGYSVDREFPSDDTVLAYKGKFHLDLGFGKDPSSGIYYPPDSVEAAAQDGAIIDSIEVDLSYSL